MSVTLIRHAAVFAPDSLGRRDILCVGACIVKIASVIDPAPLRAVFPELDLVEAEDCMALPGLIDMHMHFAGGGGEHGPEFRTPDARLSELTRAGITTAVGVLGTDGVGRSPRELYMKARSLHTEGISTWIFTGAYQLPSPTITGDVMTDIAMIDKVVGLKMAYADHRSSQPDDATLVRVVAESRLGGIVGGKSGKVMVHMGNAADGLERMRHAFARSEVPLPQMIPTHLNRSSAVFEAAVAHGKAGGNVDITSGVSERAHFPGAITPAKALAGLLDAGVPVGRITMSSDGYGAMTVPLSDGRFETRVAPVASLYEEFTDALREGVPVTDAVRMLSTNQAEMLALPGKGRIAEGMDADILLVDATEYSLKAVFAKGRKMVADGRVLVKGIFEA